MITEPFALASRRSFAQRPREEQFHRARVQLAGVLLRVGKVSGVRELTPYGWKQRWPRSSRHRARTVERLMRKVDG